MKKLSVLIALALVLTIGGAYATWSYSSNAIGNVDGGSVTVTMGDKVSDSAYGTLVATSNIAFKIEPETAVDGFVSPEEYKPAIDTPNATGSLTITFTPDANAPETYHTNATAVKISLNVTSGDYNGAIMSSTRTITISGVGSGATNWTKDGDSFTCTIDAATICGLIDLADVTLDTPDKYDGYKTAVGNTTIQISITDNVG